MDKVAFRSCSKQCEKLAVECYDSYIARVEQKISDSPTFFWSYIKTKRSVGESYPATMSDGSIMSSDGDDC